MKKRDYEKWVNEQCKAYTDENYCIIALNGEAGEVAEWYKKFVLRKNVAGTMSREDLRGELGDVLFYLTRLANLNDWTLDDIMNTNVAKITQRAQKGMKMLA